MLPTVTSAFSAYMTTPDGLAHFTMAAQIHRQEYIGCDTAPRLAVVLRGLLRLSAANGLLPKSMVSASGTLCYRDLSATIDFVRLIETANGAYWLQGDEGKDRAINFDLRHRLYLLHHGLDEVEPVHQATAHDRDPRRDNE